MATSKERNLKLVITGDTADVNKKIDTVTARANRMKVSLANSVITFTEEGKKAIATLTFMDEKLKKLERFSSGTKRATKGGSTSFTDNTEEQARVREKLRAADLREQKRVETERLRVAKSYNNELLQITKETALAQKTIAINGANSRLGIKAKAALQEKTIFRKLQADLAAIANKQKTGTLAGAAANAAKTKAQVAAQKELNKVYANTATQLDKLPKKVSKLGDEHKHWIRHVTEIVGLYRLVNFGINTIISSIKAIPKIGIELQTSKAVLESTLGSNAAASKAFKFLDKEAERVGQSILTLRENFRNLNASMSLAGESSQTVLSVFQNLNTITTSLHLSGAKTQDVFLAIAQIFNKTKVQSEELVKQLGNLLPGAFASFARSMGLQTLELAKRMQQGTVFATKNVEKFLRDMAKEFAAGFAIAEVGLQANLGRMQTSFIHLGETIFKSIDKPLTGLVKAVTGAVNGLTKLIQNSSALKNILADGLNVTLGITAGLLANFLITSKRIAAGVALIETATLSAATATGIMTAAMLRLRAAAAFLLHPAVIVGALVAIGLKLRDIANAGKGAVERLNDLNKKADKIRKKPILQSALDVAIADDSKVKEFNTLLDATAARLAKLRKRKDFLTGNRTSTTSGGKAQDAVLAIAKLNPATAYANAKEVEKVNKEINNTIIVQRKAYENLATARNSVSLKLQMQADKELEGQKALLKALEDLRNKASSAAAVKEQAYQQSLKQTSLILQKLQAGTDPAKRQAARNAEITFQKNLAQAKIKAADVGAKQELESIANIKIQQSAALRITEEQKIVTDKLTESKGKLAVQEELIAAKKDAGLITELQAFDQIQAKRLEAIDAMRNMLDAQQELAQQDPAKGLTESFTKARAAVDLLYLQMIKGAQRPKTELQKLGKVVRTDLETSLGNAFAGFIKGTKSASDAMRSFANSILDQVARLAAQSLAKQLIGLAINAYASSASASGGTTGSFTASDLGGSLNTSSLTTFTGQAKGGVNTGMSAASGTILNSPTYFPNAKPTMFASGGVVAGEAGKEAVLPLKRNAAGKLGVTAQLGSTKNQGNVYNISVTVTKDKKENSEATGNKIAVAMMKKIAQQEIATANRPGNQSNKITAFG